MVKSFQLGPNLGFFIADNAGPNDTAIRAILQDLDADIKDPDDRQVGCLGHIINLVAKAFLFGDDVESLEIHKDRSKAEIKELSWGQGRAGSTTDRTESFVTVELIKDSPQRRDEWFPIANNRIDDKCEGM